MEQVTSYKTRDGQLFDTPEKAIAHENREIELKKRNSTKRDLDDLMTENANLFDFDGDFETRIDYISDFLVDNKDCIIEILTRTR
jgi:hypothetical protein